MAASFLPKVVYMTQYDNIAERYAQGAEEGIDRKDIMAPSAKHYLGDMHGKKVLDLACGSGYFTRLFKECGAKHVVGVDISAEMIGLAEQRERQNSQGIEYHVGDASELHKFGEFDFVFAGFLLHYSSSVEQLQRMCRTISLNLRKGGRFVSFNENPFFPVHTGIKYGVTAKSIGELRDGTKIERTHYKGDKIDFSFDHYHYKPATYESTLASTGFSHIEWKPFVLSEDAADRRDFWRDWLEDFSIIVLLALKQ
jgi:ubiquinone/menaquinone biosynthesis C-methylase UbiE